MPERYKIIVDIERGKSQLTYTVTLKTAHWSEMPWALFAVCHRDPEVAVDAFSTALASESRHPQVSVLWDPALQTQVLSFCEEPRALLTQEATFMPKLRPFMAQFRLAFTAERRVESLHASSHRSENRSVSQRAVHLGGAQEDADPSRDKPRHCAC